MTEVATKTFRDWLYEKGACSSARLWVGDKTLEQAWNECTYPWWMVWLIGVTLLNLHSMKNNLLSAGFRDEIGELRLLDNPISACEFLRMTYPLEQIRQEIGDEIQ